MIDRWLNKLAGQFGWPLLVGVAVLLLLIALTLYSYWKDRPK